MYERFTDRARKVMQLANQEAQRFNHEYVGTEHILLGLIKEGGGTAADAFGKLDVDLRQVRREIERLVRVGSETCADGDLPQTPRAKKVVENSVEEARNLKHSYVGAEHLLLGLLRENEGVAAQVLFNLGLKLQEVRECALRLLASPQVNGQHENQPTSNFVSPITADGEKSANEFDSPYFRLEATNLAGEAEIHVSEKYTARASQVMRCAIEEAQRLNHEYVGTEHILLGLVKEGSGVAANVLKNLDVDLRKVRLEVEKLVQSGAEEYIVDKLPLTPRTKKVIEYSLEEARNLNHNYVGTEHVLLGLLREQEGVAAQVLVNLGLKLEEVREEVLNLLGHGLEGEGKTFDDEDKLGRLRRDRWKRVSQALSWNRDEDPQRFHPIMRPLLDQIRILDLQKREAASNNEFETAAALRDRQNRVQQISTAIRERLGRGDDAVDLIDRLCFPLAAPPQPLVRESESRQVVESLADRETVLVVAQRGSGKSVVLQAAAQMISNGAPGFEGSAPSVLHPNFLRMRQELQHVGDTPLLLMQHLLRGNHYILSISDVDACCSERTSAAVSEAWKRAFQLADANCRPLLLSCTELGLARLKAFWPGLVTRWRVQRLRPLEDDETTSVVREQLQVLRAAAGWEIVPGVLGDLVAGAKLWDGGERADPGRSLRFLARITAPAANGTEDVANLKLVELAELHRQMQESVESQDFTKSRQFREQIDRLQKEIWTAQGVTYEDLEKHQKAAEEAHDFEKAAALREQIEGLKKRESRSLGPELVARFLASKPTRD